MLDAVAPLVSAGAALHWLRPRSKAPYEADWSKKPRQTLAELTASYREGDNVGIRTGEPSLVAGHYLHLIDLDVRDPAKASEAKALLATFIPEFDDLPFVISGSGGESRHFYFLTERPFRARKLGHSPEKVLDAKGKEHWAWEIELFGTGKQVVLPPSVHPDTGETYRWGREIPFAEIVETGAGPWIVAERVEEWAPPSVATESDDDGLATELRNQPKTFTAAEIAKTLADLPLAAFCDDRDGWLNVGTALHHQFQGSPEGLALWRDFSKQSSKFDEKDLVRVWKSFGSHRNPTTMASLVKAAGRARFAAEPSDDPDGMLDGPSDPETAAMLGDAAAADPRESDEWLSLLDLNEEGAIKPTLHNVEVIFRHDPRTRDLPAFNEFTQEVMLRGEPGKLRRKRNRAKKARQLASPVWTIADPVNGDLWIDDHDYAVRAILEAPKSQGGYGLKVSDRDLRAAISMVADSRRFHPVQEYLGALVWDGVERLDTLLVRYLEADDSAYARSISRLTLLGAVVRAFEPGHKFDFVTILEGLQGKRKSSFLKILARHWFTELEGNFEDRKAMVEKMQGQWILELPELQGFRRHEVQTIKAFVSAQVDKVRLAFAHRARAYPRQCIFVGSTNDAAYLRDDTGGRRFWPISCQAEVIDTDAFEREVDQAWAEAMAVYRSMRAAQPFGTLPLYITDEEAHLAALEAQEERRVVNADEELAGRIALWLEKPLADEEGFDEEDAELLGVRKRNAICSMEVWCEMLGESVARYGQAQQQHLGRALRKLPGWAPGGTTRTGKYGKQRVMRRIGAPTI